MPSFIEPLPETVERWMAEGYPDVLVEVRPELTCTIVGTVEPRWVSVCETVPMIHVRAVVDRMSRYGDDDVAAAVRRAERARRRAIRPCARCGEPTPPEHATTCDGERVCHGCASRYFDVVF